MNLNIRKVDKENLKDILSLKVKNEQMGFIETTKECLDEAKEESFWRPVGIIRCKKLFFFFLIILI